MTTTLETPQTTPSLDTLYVAAGLGQYVDLGNHRARVKANADTTGGDLLLLEIDADYRGGVPPHVHSLADETFYVLEGTFEVWIAGEKVELGPGDTALGVRNVPHAWFCTSPGGGRLLLAVTPGSNFQAFAMKMAADNIVPNANTSKEELVEFTKFALRHGIEMLLGE